MATKVLRPCIHKKTREVRLADVRRVDLNEFDIVMPDFDANTGGGHRPDTEEGKSQISARKNLYRHEMERVREAMEDNVTYNPLPEWERRYGSIALRTERAASSEPTEEAEEAPAEKKKPGRPRKEESEATEEVTE